VTTCDGREGNRLGRKEEADECTAAPNLNLTPDEKRVFGQLFRQADTESIGVVTGEVAVKFFEKTRLEPRILGEVRLLVFILSRKQKRRFDRAQKAMLIRFISRYGKSQIRRIEGFLHRRVLV